MQPAGEAGEIDPLRPCRSLAGIVLSQKPEAAFRVPFEEGAHLGNPYLELGGTVPAAGAPPVCEASGGRSRRLALRPRHDAQHAR
ncbi:hypothetical protein ACFQY5_18995 [Paeniroseomonas aquatica]|uniref:hypothetical protein n=1 Tax=Paeniroseomonas aquatica TaxID=373043 RepID=UPI00361CCF42